jgi:hypothetical protein
MPVSTDMAIDAEVSPVLTNPVPATEAKASASRPTAETATTIQCRAMMD